ncbi:hypothetical protein ATY30_02435 [Sinorhizobium americanum]|nr:hypothetical protein CO664_27310 [Sinorhizobium sp. NG07B]POH33438.1 hypothetical protein ATY30_02435 [Sinorhizobium americanum]
MATHRFSSSHVFPTTTSYRAFGFIRKLLSRTFSKVCGTLKLARDVAAAGERPTLAENALSFGLLIETVTTNSAQKRQEAVLIFDLRTGSQRLYGETSGLTLDYRTFEDCAK